MCLALRAYFAPLVLFVFHAPHWLRRERLCVFTEERAPVSIGSRDRRVASEVHRARKGPMAGTAQQNSTTKTVSRSWIIVSVAVEYAGTAAIFFGEESQVLKREFFRVYPSSFRSSWSLAYLNEASNARQIHQRTVYLVLHKKRLGAVCITLKQHVLTHASQILVVVLQAIERGDVADGPVCSVLCDGRADETGEVTFFDSHVQSDVGVIMEMVIPVCRHVNAGTGAALAQSVVIQRGIGAIVEFEEGVFATPVSEDVAREIIMEM